MEKITPSAPTDNFTVTQYEHDEDEARGDEEGSQPITTSVSFGRWNIRINRQRSENQGKSTKSSREVEIGTPSLPVV